MHARSGFLPIFVLLGALGCSDNATTAAPGSERAPCYGNGTCNAGLVCLSDLCVAGSTPPDAGQSTPDAGSAQPDAGSAEPDADVPDTSVGDAGPLDSGLDADAEPADAGRPPDSGVHDSGAIDVGVDAGQADTGVVDAGRPDAGPDTVCNPVDTTGCAGGTDFCLWDPRIDRRTCGSANGNIVLERACDETLQNCAPGFACTQTTGQAAPECHRVCDVFTGGVSCQNLGGRHPVYNCSVINGSQQYGVCLGRGSYCDPLLTPCASGTEVCSFGPGNQFTCNPAGTALRDQPCDVSNNCASNQGICTNLGAGEFCRVACDPAQANACGANSRCSQLTGLTFGVCLPTSCQPFTDPCPPGAVCSPTAGPIECRPAGNVAIGGSCSVAMECATPGVCVNLGSGARCEAPCDTNNGCTSPQACVSLINFGFGVCR